MVSFRILRAHADLIEKRLRERPIVGVKSVNQWFRKVGLDCLSGRMTYKNSADMLVDSDFLA